MPYILTSQDKLTKLFFFSCIFYLILQKLSTYEYVEKKLIDIQKQDIDKTSNELLGNSGVKNHFEFDAWSSHISKLTHFTYYLKYKN